MRLDRVFATAVLLAVLIAHASPARADITGFLGLAGGPSTRLAKGVAVGTGLVIVGIEFEYSDTSDDEANGSPRFRTGMFNGLLQTPIPIAGFQFYATAGAGIYNEELSTLSHTSVGVNVGGGVKKSLIGPLRLRLDYRVFRLSGSPLATDVVHRFYAGANIKF